MGEFWPLLLDFQIQVVVYEIIDLLGHPTLFSDLALDPQEWKLVHTPCKARVADWN